MKKMQPLNVSDNPDDDEETLSFLPHPQPPLQNITLSSSPKGGKGGKNNKGNKGSNSKSQGKSQGKSSSLSSSLLQQEYGDEEVIEQHQREHQHRQMNKKRSTNLNNHSRRQKKQKQKKQRMMMMKRNYYENVDEDDLLYDDGDEGGYFLFHKIRRKGFCLPWMIEAILFMMIIASIVVVKSLYRDGHLQHLFNNDNDSFGNGNKNGNGNGNDSYYNDNLAHSASIQEWNDLHLDDIQHWCMNHTVTDCKCSNPLSPKARHGHSTWTHAYHENIKRARGANVHVENDRTNYDVVFLGDSILEGFKGTKFGKKVKHKQDNVQVFDSFFNANNGAEFDGLVLAIAGDKSPNLLWRLQNGELPTKLTPKIFWILIGTNDFLKDGLDHCSEDVVLMGIKRVVGELQSRKPKSTIVINGILPRAEKGREGMLYGSGSDDIDGEGGGDGNGDSAIGIMDAIDAVNAKLSEFCDTHENLHYFDGKDIFVETKEELQTEGKVVEHFIPQSLMADYLHPTSRGYQKWGRKIVDEMRSLLDGQLVVD